MGTTVGCWTGCIIGTVPVLVGYWAKEKHHGSAGLIDWHGHGCPLVVVATIQKHSAIIGTQGHLLLGCALHQVVGYGSWLQHLLLLGAHGRRYASCRRGQDGLLHSGD